MVRNPFSYSHGDTGSEPADSSEFQQNERPKSQHFNWWWHTVISKIDQLFSEFDRLDSDDDGVVDEADYANDADASTYKGNDLDSDGDGTVDAADTAAAYDGVAPSDGADGEVLTTTGTSAQWEAASSTTDASSYKGNDIDSDGDGTVNDAENVTSTYKGNDLDSDGDGTVDSADTATNAEQYDGTAPDDGTNGQVLVTDGTNTSWGSPDSGSDTHTDVSDSGSTVVADVSDINFTSDSDINLNVADDGDGSVTVDVAYGGGGEGVPSGAIMPLSSGTSVPTGWVLCDGNNGTDDLTNKFVMGGTSTNGPTGGTNNKTLSKDQMPEHEHVFNSTTTDENGLHDHEYEINDSSTQVEEGSSGNTKQVIKANEIKATYTTDDTGTNHEHGINIPSVGSGNSFDNRPAYREMRYIMKT